MAQPLGRKLDCGHCGRALPEAASALPGNQNVDAIVRPVGAGIVHVGHVMPNDEQNVLRSYGRRTGRGLSTRQMALLETCLPRLALDLDRPAPLEIRSLFAVAGSQETRSVPDDVWLEVGFGAGEHLIWQARRNPHIGLIGCEPFIDGVVKVVTAVEETDLSNVRLHSDDAREVLTWLPDNAIGRVFVLFPDPWPKTRHKKRRLIAPAFVSELARVLRPGGEFRFATDIGDYARTGLTAIMQSNLFSWPASGPSDWRNRTTDWPPTRYEGKAHKAGRCCYYFRFVCR